MRAEHAAHTRQRILEAATRLFRDDPDELSMADVAREAGVAIPTVYRHFATLEAIREAVVADADAKLFAGVPRTEGRAEIAPALRAFFANAAALGPELVALMHTRHGRAMRRARLPARRAHVGKLFADELAALPAEERAYLADWLAVLQSTAMARVFDDYVGLGPDAAADRVLWLIDVLAEHALGRKGERRR